MKKVYLAGPIDGCTDDECKNWRNEIIADRLLEWHCLDPMRRDYRGKENLYREIVELDKLVIRNSDVVLVNYTNLKPGSAGTAMEIIYAWTLGKPVVLVYGADNPWPPSPWLQYHCTRICTDMTEAKFWIEIAI